MDDPSSDDSFSDAALDLYDELVMAGGKPDAAAFAAKYPHDGTLLGRIQRLDALRRELDDAVQKQPQRAWPKAIGGYALGEQLGEGGMGAVFAVKGQPYAVKLLRSDTAIALQRFEREAAVAKTLSHPGIAALVAFGIEDGQAYLVSERISGRTLKAVREEGAPDVVHACEWLLDAAAAAGHAHEAGIIHRDIKPSNIMVTDDDRVKLIDFGLSTGGAQALTKTGVFIGSHNYAAPEQLKGEKHAIGPATDVYGLGATLYELLTGAAPFGFATFAARIEHSDAVPERAPHDVNPAVSKALSKIVMRALSPQPKRRYASVEAFSIELRRALDAR
jgi:serine/threonine protein kinase